MPYVKNDLLQPHSPQTQKKLINARLFLATAIFFFLLQPLQAKDLSQLEKGEKMFHDNCASCHGQTGDGTRFPSTVVGETLFVPSLQKSLYASQLSEDKLFKLILYGEVYLGSSRSKIRMPSFSGKLPDRDIRLLANYIKTYIIKK